MMISPKQMFVFTFNRFGVVPHFCTNCVRWLFGWLVGFVKLVHLLPFWCFAVFLFLFFGFGFGSKLLSSHKYFIPKIRIIFILQKKNKHSPFFAASVTLSGKRDYAKYEIKSGCRQAAKLYDRKLNYTT